MSSSRSICASRGKSASRLLLIDDDQEFCQLLGEYLESVGYRVAAVHRGFQGLARLQEDSWDAVILDVMMPEMDGFEVLKRIRKESDIPVLMLTARGDEMDVVVGLEIGADDYIPKTSSMRQLLARLRAVIRRTSSRQNAKNERDPDLEIGPLQISPARRECILEGHPLSLTPVEFDLLYALASARGRVKSRDALLSDIRDRDYEVYDRSIDMHISALRKKLGDNPKEPRFIRTLRSAGYMMLDPNQNHE